MREAMHDATLDRLLGALPEAGELAILRSALLSASVVDLSRLWSHGSAYATYDKRVLSPQALEQAVTAAARAAHARVDAIYGAVGRVLGALLANDRERAANELIAVGEHLEVDENVAAARLWYEAAERVAALDAAPTARARALRHLALLHVGTGEMEEATARYRASLELAVIDGLSPLERFAWVVEHLPRLPGSGIVYVLTVADAERLKRAAVKGENLFAALLDSLGIDAATVAGISGGGPSALAFAQRHPARTSGLALLCALAAHLMRVPGHARLAARAPTAVWATFAARERRKQRAMLADDDAFDAHLRAELPAEEHARLASQPGLRADYAEYLRSQCTGPSWAPGFRNDVRAIMASGVAPTDAITAPALVAHGDADTVVPIANAEHHAAVIAGARLEVLPGASHGFPLTHRDTTIELLRSLP